ncbi:NAD(P)-binding protein [Violaceomyces palustris]|uniref:NAD(P)-binding protein n=1 Tax=Violaceomyces palustris TaxID=1673888 RepID=A0ACD0NZ13_9BASI|nr:NAD(P)-binding protein [Violaceomyces palustris]
MSLDFGLTDVHVLISGASGGIGRETALCFKELGSKVTAHYNSSIRDLESISGLVPIKADVTSEEQVDQLFEQAKQRQGRPVQVLVVNHGIWPVEPFLLADMSLEHWQRTHDVNLTGSFLLIRAFLRQLKGQPEEILDKVSVVTIGSTAGKFGEKDHGDYASTKASLMYGLLPTLKNEIVLIAPKGRVNSVNPGWVMTPMAEETIKDDKVRARALASTPLQKVAMPSDVARQVAVLCSPVLSGHVTGVNVMVDGGMEGRCLYPPPN